MVRSNVDKAKILSKLNRLTRSAENIQKMSAYLMQFNRNPEPIIEAWMDAMRQASDDQKKLTLIYVANEILQTCKKHRASEFRSIWKDFLPEVISMMRGSSVVERIQRILEIWASREVFDAHYIKELTEMMAAQSKISGQDLEEVDKNIIDKYKPDETLSSLKQLVLLETEESDLAKEAIQMEREVLTLSSPTSGPFKQAGDGRGAVDQSDRYMAHLSKLCTCSHSQMKSRRKLWDSLRKAEVFYTAQYEDAGVVVKAYTNYGSRISRVKSLLRERITSLSAGGAALLDDDSLSPSGTEVTEPPDDLEGRIVKMQQAEESDSDWSDQVHTPPPATVDPECQPPPPPPSLPPPLPQYFMPPPLMPVSSFTPNLPPPNPYAFNIISTLTGMNTLSQRNVPTLPMGAPLQPMQAFYQQGPSLPPPKDSENNNGGADSSLSPIGQEASANQQTIPVVNHQYTTNQEPHRHHKWETKNSRHNRSGSPTDERHQQHRHHHHDSGGRKRAHSDDVQSIAVIGGGRSSRQPAGNDLHHRGGAGHHKHSDHRYSEKEGRSSHSSGEKRARHSQYPKGSAPDIHPPSPTTSTPPPQDEPRDSLLGDGAGDAGSPTDAGGATPTQDEPPDMVIPIQAAHAYPTYPSQIQPLPLQHPQLMPPLACRSQSSILGPPPPTPGPYISLPTNEDLKNSSIRPLTSTGGWAAWRQTFSPAPIRASPLPSLHTIPVKTLPHQESASILVRDSEDHHKPLNSAAGPGNRLFRSPNQFRGAQHPQRHSSYRARLTFFPNQSKTFRPRDPRQHFFK